MFLVQNYVEMTSFFRHTTALFIAVVPAVIIPIAHCPQWYATVVGSTAELRVVVTPISRTH